MTKIMGRVEAFQLLGETILPTLSLAEREAMLLNIWEAPDDESPIAAEVGDSAERALGIVHSDEGYTYIVSPEPPDDSGHPGYDALLLDLIQARYVGTTNQYVSDELARIGHSNITVVGEPELLQLCHCCGYRTLGWPGDYEICPVCSWENDGTSRPEQYSHPNHMTLAEGRRNYQILASKYPGVPRSADRPPEKYVRAMDFPFG